MKIAVNTRLLIPGKLNGIGWFTYHTLKRLVSWHPEHQFIFLFDRKFDNEFVFNSNVIPEVVFPPARHPFLWYLWFEHSIIKTFKKHKPDIFFSPDGYLSTRLEGIPMFPVIHDINFHHDKKNVPLLDGIFWRYYFPKYVKMASRIITVSEFSKNDIASYYNIAPQKIDVAYNGAHESFRPLNKDEKQKVRDEFSGGGEYFVFVGAMVPRKNISSMILAFDKFKMSTGSKIKLLIVGEKLYFTSEMKQAYCKAYHRNEIIFTGRLDQNQLARVVGAAMSLILVSTLEGFGIPVVEAMYAEVPVITSNITALPEISGNAALLVNPHSIDSIFDAMKQMTFDEKLRKDLIVRGAEQRKIFSWDNTARVIWSSFEKSAG